MSPVAILIFARTAVAESNFKRIAKRDGDNLAFFESVNNKIATLAASTELPYFICDERQQSGDTFGCRLTNAAKKIFSAGFEKILILGNDCPQLSEAKLKVVTDKLQNNKLVIGPDYNGGAYIIGIDKSIFDENTFPLLRWQTKFLFSDLKHIANAVILPRLYDINKLEDAQKAVFLYNITTNTRKLLLLLLQTAKQLYVSVLLPCYQVFTFIGLPLRAPPAI